MSEVGDAIEEVRTELAGSASEFMPDLCDLIPPSLQEQGAGHTIGEGTVIFNIPCLHEHIGGGVSFHDGESVVTKTERLQLPFSSSTVAIKREYQIKVHARGLNPQMILEHPVIRTDSMSPLLQVLAEFTPPDEGYRQPGIT